MVFDTIVPKKIAIILLSNDDEIIQSQLKAINNVDFEMELYFPKKENRINFYSFSSLINDSIENTKSEFMIFINPKTIIKSGDISFIIDQLCSGKCFVSLVNFGFFGTTKEFFRNFGLMDERYVGGEFEDEDFLLRLKLFGKAVYLKRDLLERYSLSKSKYDPNRGSTTTIFMDKWNYNSDNDTYYVCKSDLNHRKLNNKIKTNQTIKYTWESFDKSYISNDAFYNRLKSNITVLEKEKKLEECNFNLKLCYNNDIFRTELNCDKKISFSVLISRVSDGNYYDPIINYPVSSNSWWEMPILDQNEIEVTVFHSGVSIYKNIVTKGFSFSQHFKTFTYILDTKI